MTTTLIGLSGYARSGKDTVAQTLAAHGYKRMAFADPMREALYTLNPNVDVEGYRMTLQQAVNGMGWEALKDLSNELRPLLQRFGTEVCRHLFGQDIWVDTAMRQYRYRTKWGDKIVFTDVRFENEADAVRNAGGQVWRIERPGTEPANTHVSERALDGYDFDLVIDNDGTLAELKEKVENAL
jgi:hypothetical protein